MKLKVIAICLAVLIAVTSAIIAADHLDSPGVTGPNNTTTSFDIADIYAFQSPADNSKMVFVMTTQGLLSPNATAATSFPSDVLYEFNIDNTGDNVEDLVIQCGVQNDNIRVYGPAAVTTPGTKSMINANASYVDAKVTEYGSNPKVGSKNGISVFAGPRDDPFFFDLTRFREVIAGTQTSFRNPGVDAFAGTNVMAIVVEVPKSALGNATTINLWGETKVKKN